MSLWLVVREVSHSSVASHAIVNILSNILFIYQHFVNIFIHFLIIFSTCIVTVCFQIQGWNPDLH